MKLTVVPGWGEGKRQMNRVVLGLNAAGMKAQYARSLSPRLQYDWIVAHSGGSYQRWSKLRAKHLVLVAPPWNKLGGFTMNELSRRAQARRRRRSDRNSAFETLRFLASLRSTYRHSRAVRSIDLLGELTDWLDHDQSRTVTLIVYEGDVWTDLEITQAFDVLPRTDVITLVGSHDDLRSQPQALIELIASRNKSRHS